MERAATACGKLNRVDLEDEQAIPLDKILVQPFTVTDDPRILDIENIEFEEVDLEFDPLFPDNEVESPKADKTGNEYYDKVS